MEKSKIKNDLVLFNMYVLKLIDEEKELSIDAMRDLFDNEMIVDQIYRMTGNEDIIRFRHLDKVFAEASFRKFYEPFQKNGLIALSYLVATLTGIDGEIVIENAIEKLDK